MEDLILAPVAVVLVAAWFFIGWHFFVKGHVMPPCSDCRHCVRENRHFFYCLKVRDKVSGERESCTIARMNYRCRFEPKPESGA